MEEVAMEQKGDDSELATPCQGLASEEDFPRNAEATLVSCSAEQQVDAGEESKTAVFPLEELPLEIVATKAGTEIYTPPAEASNGEASSLSGGATCDDLPSPRVSDIGSGSGTPEESRSPSPPRQDDAGEESKTAVFPLEELPLEVVATKAGTEMYTPPEASNGEASSLSGGAMGDDLPSPDVSDIGSGSGTPEESRSLSPPRQVDAGEESKTAVLPLEELRLEIAATKPGTEIYTPHAEGTDREASSLSGGALRDDLHSPDVSNIGSGSVTPKESWSPSPPRQVDASEESKTVVLPLEELPPETVATMAVTKIYTPPAEATDREASSLSGGALGDDLPSPGVSNIGSGSVMPEESRSPSPQVEPLAAYGSSKTYKTFVLKAIKERTRRASEPWRKPTGASDSTAFTSLVGRALKAEASNVEASSRYGGAIGDGLSFPDGLDIGSGSVTPKQSRSLSRLVEALAECGSSENCKAFFHKVLKESTSRASLHRRKSPGASDSTELPRLVKRAVKAETCDGEASSFSGGTAGDEIPSPVVSDIGSGLVTHKLSRPPLSPLVEPFAAYGSSKTYQPFVDRVLAESKRRASRPRKKATCASNSTASDSTASDSTAFSSPFGRALKKPETLNSCQLDMLAEGILRTATMVVSNAKPAAKLCLRVITGVTGEAFMQFVLLSCHKGIAERLKQVRDGAQTRRLQWFPYINFLAELLALLEVKGVAGSAASEAGPTTPVSQLAKLLCLCCRTLLSSPWIQRDETVPCIKAALIIAGRHIKREDPEQTKYLIISLRDCSMREDLPEKLRKSLRGLVQFHETGWRSFKLEKE